MIIIGEKLNSTRKAVKAAVEAYDAELVTQLATAQADAEADFIDINAGTFPDDEPERLKWLAETVQSCTRTPLCFDSPNIAALEAAFSVYKGKKAIINSITDEKARYSGVLELAQKYGAGVIALTMDDNGMPEDAGARVKIADRLINRLIRDGMKPDKIYVDTLIRPVSTGDCYGRAALDAMREVRKEFPEVHICGGLSNVSFGLPERKLLNTAFLVCAMANGLDSAILDPLDAQLRKFMTATSALLGQDEYCAEYISAFREGLLS